MKRRQPSTVVSRRHGSVALVILLLIILAVGAVVGLWFYFQSATEFDEESIISQTVREDRFEHFVLEQGEVESSSNVEVVCKVKARNSSGTAILWVIPEGTKVKKGEKLVELDASALDQELKQQRITVNTSEALKITAESALEQAKVAMEEYTEGTFKQEEQTILSEILVAQENLSRAEETAKFSERLTAEGFQTELQLKADRFAVQKAEVELSLAQNKLKTLREITRRKMLIGFKADIATAHAQAEAEISSHKEELDKLAEIEQQIKNCVIFAPQAGQVVHANRYSSRGGSAEFVVEAGAMVRERQAIIRLPDPTQMQVLAKISESRVPLVEEGDPVTIQIGAFENETLKGRVIKVNKYAEPSSWFSSQVKKYATMIEIIDPPPDIRTGMTAEVKILVEEFEKAAQIPVQAVHEVKQHTFCLVKKGGAYETREVKIGPSNDRWIIVEDGLAVGEQVVMNPRQHEGLLDIPDLPDPPPEKAKPVAATKPPPKPDSPASLAENALEQFDTDKDGILSADEIAKMPQRQQQGMERADKDKDGAINRAELISAMVQRLQRRKQQEQGSGDRARQGAGE